MSRPRIALVTAWDARTPAFASGISHFMARALQRHVGDVDYLGPAFSWHEFSGKVLDRVRRNLSGTGRAHVHGQAMAKEFARIFTRRIHPGTDFVFAPMASTQIAYLDTSIPIVYSSDTTFALLSDYYPEYTGLNRRYRSEADEIESLAIHHARVVSYPSEWAARSAVGTYGADGRKVHVVPWGANLEEVPEQRDIARGKTGPGCRLLFLGKDWERKGGPLAYEIVLELRRRGIAARLTIIGCKPGAHLDPAAVTVIGAIDKSDPRQRRTLSQYLLDAHFLLQPSRHESLGVVYCEASAHGTPSLATDTGGIAGVVFNHENGFRFPVSAGPDPYADLIAGLMADPVAYAGLVTSTRHAFDTRLNWDAWARRMGEVMAACA